MGKSRSVGNLASENLIYVDIASDRVGIGTTVPSSILDVYGPISINGSKVIDVSGGGSPNINAGVVTATSFVGNLTGTATGLSGTPNITVGFITATGNISVAGTLTYEDVTNVDSIGLVTARSGAHVATVSGNLLVGTTSPTGTSSQPLQVTGGAYVSGNLGVAVTNPTTRLDVSGIGQFTSNGGSLNLVGTDHTYIQWYPDGISAGRKGYTGYPDASSDNFTIFNQIANAGIVFGTSDGEKARITNPGYLLLGLTIDNPSSAPEPARLVSGGSAGQAAAHFYTDQTSKTLVYFSRTAFGITGTITTSGSSTAYNTTSDYRLKENVVPLTGAIQRLLELPVHRFNFISEPDKTVDGFIAHEASEVVPECVTGKKDEVDDNGNPIHQGIDQSKLVPLLTAALQEAIARIETLEKEVQTLKGTTTT